MRHWSPWIEEVVGEMVEDGVTQRCEPRPRAALQRACPSRATSRRSPTGSTSTAARIHFEHVPSYHDAPGSRGGIRRARGGWALALAGGRARSRPRRLQRAQPSAARARVGRSVRRAVPRDGAARRGARRAAGRALVVGVPVRRPHARSRGPGPISASTSPRSRRRACATSSRSRSGSSPTTSRSSSTSTTGRLRSPPASGCGSSGRRR